MRLQGFMTGACTALLVLMLTLTGCSDNQDAGDQAEQAGEAVEEGAQAARDKAEDAAEDMEAGADKAREEMEDGDETP